MTIDKKISTICLAILLIILIAGLWIVHFSRKCSIVHPEFCDNACNTDVDCRNSEGCGCLNIKEECLGGIDSNTHLPSCKCVNNVCQAARFGDSDTACNNDSNCRLVYTGSNPCAPCDSSIDDYKCLNLEKARELDIEKQQYRDNKKIECGACPLPEYSCSCSGQYCKKIKIK